MKNLPHKFITICLLLSLLFGSLQNAIVMAAVNSGMPCEHMSNPSAQVMDKKMVQTPACHQNGENNCDRTCTACKPCTTCTHCTIGVALFSSTSFSGMKFLPPYTLHHVIPLQGSVVPTHFRPPQPC